MALPPPPDRMTASQSPSPDNRDVRAMVDLLADADPKIRARVIDHLTRAGQRAIDALHSARPTALHAERIAEALAAIRRAHALGALEWFRSVEPDGPAETGALLVARVLNPGIDPDEVRRALDDLAAAVPDDVRSSDPTVGLQALAAYMCRQRGFDGARADYPNPANSLLDRVIVRRTGLPITLAVVYLAVAARVGMPLAGVGLPAHFVLRHPGATDRPYLDAFNGGRLLDEAACRNIVRAHGFTLTREHLAAVSPQEIAARICRNLVVAYRGQHDVEREQLAREAHRRLRPNLDLPGE